jgi:hypothetical protein
MTVTVDSALVLLNACMALDPKAMHALIESRVPCNDALADHPTVQVLSVDGQPHVGILGLINGLFGTDQVGRGPIAAVFGDDGKLASFEPTQD